MKKLILLAVVLVGAASATQAGVHFSLGLGIPLGPPPPVVVSPPPVVYQAPAPVYPTPAPVYTVPGPVVQTAPVYQAPPPVVYQAPAPVVVSPPPVVCVPAPSVVIGLGGRPFYPAPGYYYGHWRGHGR